MSKWHAPWNFSLSSQPFFESQNSELFAAGMSKIDWSYVTRDHWINQLCGIFDICLFYEPTIQLEEVTEHHSLGFTICASDHTVVFNQLSLIN